MNFDRAHFKSFCSKLTIRSKEGGEDEDGGRTQLLPLIENPPQSYLVDQIEIGLGAGIRFFVIEKCRQMGGTTICMALGIYWGLKIDGLIHNFIGDVPLTTSINRSLCRDFLESLNKYPEWRYDIKEDNDEYMKFSNNSMIIWHVANKRKSGQLGKSIGAAAAHGSELADWEDEEGANSFMSSMAENNPDSIFLFESKPGGRGLWKRMCRDASAPGNTTEKHIFIGWWRHPWYRSQLDNPVHKHRHDVYWSSNPTLSRDESIWVDGVKKRYDFDITPEHISWWRWHLKQRKGNELDSMYMHYPPLPEYGWRHGSKTFFNVNRITELKNTIDEERKAEKSFYRFDTGRGVEFSDSKFIKVDPRHSYYDLIVWDQPMPDLPGYRTAIGVDPVFGADQQSNDASVQVLFCFTDCCVQAAEFCRNAMPAYQLAWVVLHLAGWYLGRPKFCCELQGGGYEVQNEIRRLQMDQAWGYSPILEKAFEGIEHYIWSRPDARRTGMGASLHWKMTEDTKGIMLQAFAHYFERRMLDVRSPQLLAEMEEVNWDNEGNLDVPRPNDRLMAMGLSVMAYKQVLDTDIGGAKDHTGQPKWTRAWWQKALRESSGQTQGEFLRNLLSDWRDRRVVDSKEDKEYQLDIIEARENIAPGRFRGYFNNGR